LEKLQGSCREGTFEFLLMLVRLHQAFQNIDLSCALLELLEEVRGATRVGISL
jgi:hypothetical protein